MSQAAANCFHCGEPLAGSRLHARIAGSEWPVCCAGCRAVAELISASGLEDYYDYREASPPRPATMPLDDDAWAPYSRPEVAAQFVRNAEGVECADLLIDGLRCAACTWLIERSLQAHPGARSASVNAATGRAHVEWDMARTDLGAVMRSIARLGYRPQPVTAANILRCAVDERRAGLKRLAVAAFGMMQVMMFAVATYCADLAGEAIDAGLLRYFNLVSLLLATPVLLYAGGPILVNAWRTVRARAIGMDVPVGIALVLAYTASMWNTFRGTGEVYFDSVTMFIFFITLGRLVESAVRHRTASCADALSRHLPAIAHRVRDDGVDDVAISQLAVDDILLVRSGEIVPADGVIHEGNTTVNEALLTGESLPVNRRCADRITAGSINVGAPVRMRITAVGQGTVLSGIAALLARAQAQRPAAARAADRAARVFLSCVLAAAALTGTAWLAIDPGRAFEAVLAVLVAACPCAFAIASPAALAAAVGNLASHGLLTVHPDAIATLARVRRVVFDKTGTLTEGRIQLRNCTALTGLGAGECMTIAAAIESESEHPIARAFQDVPRAGATATEVRTVSGGGVEGRVGARRYRIGTAEFVASLRNAAHTERLPGIICLGDEQELLATFEIADTSRADSPPMITALHRMRIATEVLSGDSRQSVVAVARECGIPQFFAECSPTMKVERIQQLQRQGECLAMLGDGINDAPVLGAADVSIAMGRGAALALSSCDMVLVNEDLSAIPAAIFTARKAVRIASQNLVWSALYNMVALSCAALGLVPPWLAAAGMSLSSVAVVLNSMRLLPRPRATGHAARPLADSRPAPGLSALVPRATQTAEIAAP